MLSPVIAKADPDADPVVSVVVAGDKSPRVTTEIADKQTARPETIDGGRNIDGTARAIRLLMDAEKLNARITIQVQRAVQRRMRYRVVRSPL
jgi:hypothetical protein